MKYAIAAFAAAALLAGGAVAQDKNAAGSSSGSSSMKMTSAECNTLWQQAHGSSAGSMGLTEAQAKNFVTDFKAANPDGDSTIDQNEWTAACNKGLVKSSSSTGSSTGTSGSSSKTK